MRCLYRGLRAKAREIGGQVAGNTLLLQGQVNPPVTELRREHYFTTACNYYGAEMRGVMGRPQRVSFQRLPRVGTLQAFDFMVHARGALLGRFDPLVEVLSVVQKDNRLHARLGPLGGRRTLLPEDRGVLWEPGNGERTVFGLRPFSFHAGAGGVAEVTPEGDRPVKTIDGFLSVRPWRVYRCVRTVSGRPARAHARPKR
jgi:hypothetical protein